MTSTVVYIATSVMADFVAAAVDNFDVSTLYLFRLVLDGKLQKKAHATKSVAFAHESRTDYFRSSKYIPVPLRIF